MKKSQLRQTIREEIERTLKENPQPKFENMLSEVTNKDIARIIKNFEDKYYLPAMDDRDRSILISVLKRAIK